LNRRRLTASLFFIFISAIAAFSESGVFLRNIDFSVDGISQPFALLNAAEIKGTESFSDKASFEEWIADRTQNLRNQRVLESADIIVSYGAEEASGRIPADIVIKVKDTWNIVALPKPELSSNDGLILTLKARDYNFLGTMQPLRFDLGYELEPEYLNTGDFAKGSYFFQIDSNTPFRALGFDWKFDFDHSFSYVFGEPLVYANTTGLAITVPYKTTEFTFGAYQGTYFNEKNGDDYQAEYGKYYSDVWYLASWLEASWKIPTGLKVGRFGDLSYTPSATFKNKYRPFGDIGYERKGPTFDIDQTLSFERIDWIGNFRRGLSGSISNTNTYNFTRKTWDRSLNFETIGHLPLASWVGVSGRAVGAYHFDEYDDAAGSYLRGIVDDSVYADYGLFLNLDLPFRLIRFVPYEWFGIKWMKIFQFEQQWSLFTDSAIVSSEEQARRFTLSDALVTGGIEVVMFPLFMRSFYLRLSLGVNALEAIETKTVPTGNNREYFIGIGHQY